jgi:PAS domain S-box-containing protein
VTIGLSSVAAVLAGYFVLQRQSRLLERTVVELREGERAKAALIEERHLLNALMDNLPDVIYFKDRESRFTRINLAHAKEFGLSHPSQAVGKTDFDFFNAEHAQSAYRDEQEIIRTGQPMVGKEEKETWPDGRVTWVSTTKMPLHDPNGDIIGTFGVSRDITERKRVEDALRDSDEKYRVLYESSRDAIMMTAPPEWKFTAGNPAAIALFRARDEREFMAAAPWTLSPEYQPDGELSSVKAPQMINAAMERGSHFFEWTHKKFSGEEFLATVTLTRMTYRGQPLLQATVRDITERKRAETEMAEQQRLATLVAEVGVALTQAENLRQGLQQCAEILAPNIGAAFARVWTLNEEECNLELQASAGMYTHLDGGHARVPLGKFKIGRIAESGEPHLTNSVQEDSWVGDPEWARREGMVAFAGYPLKIEGRVLGVVAAFARQPLTEATLQAFASVADTTAQFIKRKRAEQQTRLQTAALESAANGIVIASLEGRIIWVNPAFTRLTGYPASEVIGKNQRILKSGVHDAVFYQKFWNTILSGEVWQGEIVNRRKDGTLYTEETTITPVRDAQGTISHFIAIKQDITARKRAEESLRESEERFRATFRECRDRRGFGGSCKNVPSSQTRHSGRCSAIARKN